MTTEQKKYFTIQEANDLIPSVSLSFRRIFQMNHQVSSLVSKLKNNQIDPSIIMINQNEEYDEDTIDYISSIKILLSTIQKEVDTIKKQGIVINSIEKGLLSFNSKHGEKDITLRWQVGDQEICQWLDHKDNEKSISELTMPSNESPS
ncbi:MAG: DUF2203 family protein [Candidatus Comchoanobacterales bacterium]